jgi:transposase-like protein
MTSSGEQRAAPMYCPYCGEEDLRPNEASHGAWECRGCARVFSVKFLGLAAAALKETQ